MRVPLRRDAARGLSTGTDSPVTTDSSTIILKSDQGTPTRYQFSEKTTFVDADGNVVSRETIRNQPVTIYTEPEGGSTIISKVVVGRPGETVRRERTIEEHRSE